MIKPVRYFRNHGISEALEWSDSPSLDILGASRLHPSTNHNVFNCPTDLRYTNENIPQLCFTLQYLLWQQCKTLVGVLDHPRHFNFQALAKSVFILNWQGTHTNLACRLYILFLYFMGRRAKYQTLSEKYLAKASCNASFNHTQAYVITFNIIYLQIANHWYNSGRLLRQSQNRTAYLKRKAKLSNVNIPDLPASALAYAQLPLRATHRFNIAYEGSSNEHQFNLGLDVEPYHQLPSVCPPCSISDIDVLNLRHTVNGEQLRALEVEGRKRFAELVDTEIFEEGTQRLSREVDVRLAHWLQLEEREDQFMNCQRAGLLYDLSLEWGARVLYFLRDELEKRRSGLLNFKRVYMEEKLAWQNISLYD